MNLIIVGFLNFWSNECHFVIFCNHMWHGYIMLIHKWHKYVQKWHSSVTLCHQQSHTNLKNYRHRHVEKNHGHLGFCQKHSPHPPSAEPMQQCKKSLEWPQKVTGATPPDCNKAEVATKKMRERDFSVGKKIGVCLNFFFHKFFWAEVKNLSDMTNRCKIYSLGTMISSNR